MPDVIPVDRLSAVSNSGADGVSVLDNRRDAFKPMLNAPFRRDFYAVGVCLRGTAILQADLETYPISPATLIASPPQTISQWICMSDDFETLSVLFAKHFIAENNNLNLDQFRFFENCARHAFNISDAHRETIIEALQFLQAKCDAPHIYKNKILANLVSNLLFETAAIYEQHDFIKNSHQTRTQTSFTEFKKLVNAHSTAERGVKFYAAKLFITPKHLSESVKAASGKTAGEWIADAVVLEAKVLLQNSALSVSQIADSLGFSDPSAFGRFFKKNAGLSPSAYKQSF